MARGEITSPPSDQELMFQKRPSMCTSNKICRVSANYISVHVNDKPDFSEIHQYDVSISPVTLRWVNYAVMRELVNKHTEVGFQADCYAYDGSKKLYTLGELNLGSSAFKITLQDKEDGPDCPRALKRHFDVTIKCAAFVSMESLYGLYDLMPDHVPQAILQALHIVLRELPTEEWHTQSAGSIYSPSIGGHQQLGGFLESRRGFHQSIRPTQRGLMLNIDLSSTVFIKPLTVMDFLKMLLNRDVSDTPLSGTDLLKIVKALEGVKVHVLCNMHKEYRVSGVTSQSAKELTFPVDSHPTGEPGETVVQHFQKKYGVSIQYKSLNCLQVGTPQRPKFLPLEVCKIAKGQRYSKQLNPGKQMADFLKVAKQPPYAREKGILQALHVTTRNQCAVKLGIKIEDEPVSLQAHILSPPLVKFNGSGTKCAFLPHYGQWNMKCKKMVKGGRVNNWTCINFSSNMRQNEATNFCYELVIMCQAFGMDFDPSPVLSVETTEPEQAQLALTSLHNNVMTKLGPGRNLDLLMGGRNTVLSDAIEKKLPHVTDTPTIIFGAVVTHPHPRKRLSPSIASVVASQDWPEVTRYAGLVSAQTGRHEWINSLFELQYDSEKGIVTETGGMIREHLISFYRATGQKPQRIIFYRDGVSKGQYSLVLKNELRAIKLACKSLEKDYNPTVTYVVVQKRHRTRLFPSDYREEPCDSSCNLWTGTVVDSVICHPDEFDFYLCSHSCSRAKGRGTIRPMYYHVLWDENKFLSGAFHTLTYYLCYMYAGCTHAISIVPPLRYARRLASRARCYTEPQWSSSESGCGSTASGGATTSHSWSSSSSPRVVRLLPIKENLKACFSVKFRAAFSFSVKTGAAVSGPLS